MVRLIPTNEFTDRPLDVLYVERIIEKIDDIWEKCFDRYGEPIQPASKRHSCDPVQEEEAVRHRR